MTLTREERDTLNGRQGEAKAKLMKILVTFGKTFGANNLVDLGGAPHRNLSIGAGYNMYTTGNFLPVAGGFNNSEMSDS